MNDGANVVVTTEPHVEGGITPEEVEVKKQEAASKEPIRDILELERKLQESSLQLKEYEQRISELQEKHKQELHSISLRSKVTSELLKHSPQDVEIVLGLIQFDKLGESLEGLDVQIEELKKSREFLFKKDWNPRSEKPSENLTTKVKENSFGKWLLGK